MDISQIIGYIFIALSLISFFKPFFLLYLFSTAPVLSFIPTLTKEEGQFLLAQIGPLNIFLNDYLLILLVIVFLYTIFKQYVKNKPMVTDLLISPISKMSLLFFVWAIFFGLLSYTKGFQFQNVIRVLSPEFTFLIVFLMPLLDDIDHKRENFFNYCIFLSIMLTLFGAIRYFVTNETEFTSSGTKRTLLGYTINNFIFPVCYVLFYGKLWDRHKLSAYLIVLSLGFGIGFTGHRSGWVVFFFVICLYFISQNLDRKKYLWVPLFALSFVPVIILISPFMSRIPGQSIIGDTLIRISDTFNFQNNTTQERFNKWTLSVEILKNNPLLGLGRLPINTDNIDSETNSHLLFFYEFNKDTHNVFASTIAHEGILGLGVLILFFIIIFKQLTKIKFYDYNFSLFSYNYLLSFIIISMFNATFTEISCKFYFYTIISFINHSLSKEYLFSESNEYFKYNLNDHFSLNFKSKYTF